MVAERGRVGRLLGRTVLDAGGTRLGRVHEVQLRVVATPAGPRFEVDHVLVGPASVARRLGLAHGHLEGPWPLSTWARRAEARACAVAWADIEARDDILRVRRTGAGS